ncbi:rhodanese-related sulfurtransferase [Patescibacteria group bacterium]|nr:rhodanese-related sulfurtransferase [Patescibacteria group bacterium]
MSFQVLLFYKYVTIDNPVTFADWFALQARTKGLTGRALIAEEGLNATVEGTVEQTEKFVQQLHQDERLRDMNIKRSPSDGSSFRGLSVKIRPEIVGTKFTSAEADPRIRTAPHLSPEKLREMYANNEDFVVIDMRNSYEFVSGHFKQSIDPGLRASRDLKKAVVKLTPYKDKKIVTVCTGGIRCEKMSAYLLNHGFRDVSQLENGIHAYLEKFPNQDFLGTLYTFDERISLDFGGEREIVGQCHRCQTKTERYLNCANDECHLHLLICVHCAPSGTDAFCSRTCAATALVLRKKERVKDWLTRSKKQLRHVKRLAVGRYRSVVWGLRTGRLLRAKRP